MKLNKYFGLLFLGLIILISSCKKDDNETSIDTTEQYFPVTVGLTRIYQVDSIYWDEFFHKKDTVSYQIKEVIASEFTDLQGRVTQQIDRYRQDSVSGNWMIWKVWFCNKTKNNVQVAEDNTRFVKLTFPAKESAHWNGNAYNPNDPQDYEITAFDEEDQLDNGTSFPNTLTVTQINYEDLLTTDFSEERYAEGVGMYYRKNTHLEHDIGDPDVKAGYDYTESLISYSFN